MKRSTILLMMSLMTFPILSFARVSAVPMGGDSGGSNSAGGQTPSGGNGGGHNRGTGHPSSPAAIHPRTVIKMQHVYVPSPDRIRNQQHVVRDRTWATYPRQDDRGRPISQAAATVAPSRHVEVVRNPTVIHNITREQRVEVVPNRYYWHTVGGLQYCHYYDHGIHWYGFYHGPSFYWTRYYGNRWWWFDVSFNRWVYFWDGYWWWPSPTGVAYVYVDNNYYPYEDNGVTVQRPEVVAPPVAQPTPTEGRTSDSPDGRRMVQIYGDRSEAFLYDKTVARPAFIKYLGDNVTSVRFSGGTGGKPLQILIDYNDNNFALFSEDGDPIDTPSASAPPFSQTPPSTPPTAPPSATP